LDPGSLFPDDPELLALIGGQTPPPARTDEIRKADSLFTDDPELLALIGQTPPPARTDEARKADLLFPDDPELLALIGQTSPPARLDETRKADSLFPDDPELLALAVQTPPPARMDETRKADSLSPDDPELLAFLAMMEKSPPAPSAEAAEDIADPTKPHEEKPRGKGRTRESLSAIWSALRTLLIFAAITVLVSTLWLPVLQVQKTSMAPTLQDGEILIFITTGNINKGDIVAFYYGNQILIKRVVATTGDWVDIDADGVVSVNGETLEDPYPSEYGPGECTVALPLQVPDNQFFVLGDNRSVSLDSRISEIGTIHRDKIVGKAIVRVWPFARLGLIHNVVG